MKHAQTYPEGVGSPDPWEEARKYGVDMSALDANLRLSVTQRIRNHDRALATADMLRQAMERRHEKN
jgi:hypothetical protein